MRKLGLALTVLAGMTTLGASSAEAGCYRVGLSGYHYYRSCVGPGFLYAHHRRCYRHGCYVH